jgi:hypothetical protein
MNNKIKSEYYSTILEDIIGFESLDSLSARMFIMNNIDEIDYKIFLYKGSNNDREVYNAILEVESDIYKVYDNFLFNYMKMYALECFNHSIDFILTNYKQEEILLKLNSFIKEKGLSMSFGNSLKDYLERVSSRLNKRFCFDDLALINLIEASTGKNIQSQENRYRREGNSLYYSDGNYRLKNNDNQNVSTLGTILSENNCDGKEKSKIYLDSYPLGSVLPLNSSKNEALMIVMNIFFDNLNLCLETYNSIYTKGNNVVHNSANMSDGSVFDFDFVINERNIPHLLGIPVCGNLNQESIDALNKLSDKKPIELSKSSSACDLLKVILKNRSKIVACGGLYLGSDGKLYQLLNFEKMILKTTSFMRSDFFKTCFCIVKLSDDKYLCDRGDKGGYITITSTSFNKDMKFRETARSILNELFSCKPLKKDFIFRGFHYDGKTLIPETILTGKSENIRFGKNKELLRTLQKYRDILAGAESGSGKILNESENSDKTKVPFEIDDSFASIVTSVENESYIKEFSSCEQARLAIDLSRELGISPRVNYETLGVIKDVYDNDSEIAKRFNSGEIKSK